MTCIICQSDKEKKVFYYKATQYYECMGCGLIRTLPFPSNADLVAHYKKGFESGNYFALHTKKEMYADIYKQYLELIKKKIDISGKKILDVGCFTGDFLDMAQDEGALTFGVEIQSEAAEIANKKHFGRVLNCSLDETFFSEKFDVVTAFGLIEHVQNPDALLRLASHNLADGGLLVIQTPNSGSFLARLLGKYWPPYTPIEHIHHFSKKNIEHFLKSFHFSDISVMPHYKKLSVEYVYEMLHTFGSEFRALIRPIFNRLPNVIKKRCFTFYVGEMIVLARAPSRKKSGDSL